jgi:hypothetical protein
MWCWLAQGALIGSKDRAAGATLGDFFAQNIAFADELGREARGASPSKAIFFCSSTGRMK